MSKAEIEKLLDDPWSELGDYPYGKEGLLKAIKKASKLGIFDLEEIDGQLRVKTS